MVLFCKWFRGSVLVWEQTLWHKGNNFESRLLQLNVGKKLWVYTNTIHIKFVWLFCLVFLLWYSNYLQDWGVWVNLQCCQALFKGISTWDFVMHIEICCGLTVAYFFSISNCDINDCHTGHAKRCQSRKENLNGGILSNYYITQCWKHG